MYQGSSDDFIGLADDIVCASESYGIDFEAEVAVITSDVGMASTPDEALRHVRLLMLVNDVSLRNLIPAELAKGFGFYQSKPATAFSPVVVTPDELGDAWREGRVHRPMIVHWNGRKVGQPDCGTDMVFHFGQLIAHASKTRNLRAGSIVGFGTISNKDAKRGYCCIAEKRCLETIEHGKPETGFMKFGDSVRIEMFDEEGKSIFGAIDQVVVQPELLTRPDRGIDSCRLTLAARRAWWCDERQRHEKQGDVNGCRRQVFYRGDADARDVGHRCRRRRRPRRM